jgi:hypothetical protein
MPARFAGIFYGICSMACYLYLTFNPAANSQLMRYVYLVLFMMTLPGFTASSIAQGQESGFYRDAKGRYHFDHIAAAPGVPKAILYERLKVFIVEDLNASDTRINWDESGQDSVTTIAYIELGDGPEMTNQLVDCKARLDFAEGQVRLRLSSFNYSGKRVDSDASYARALHRMSPVSNTAQSYALTALEEILRQLMVKMDAVAMGEVARPEELRSKKR